MKPYCPKILIGVLGLVLTCVSDLSAQEAGKQITHQQLVWYGYFNTLELSPKWFLTSEVQERHFVDPFAQHQFLVRSHLHYRIGNNWDGALGFTYYLQSPQDPNDESDLVVPELRPHLEFNYRQTAGKFTVTHRYKLEWRFFHNVSNGELTEGYRDYFRFRYRLGLEYPLVKRENGEPLLKLRVSDEIMFNVGEDILYNFFDQNRFYVGLNYPLNKNLSVEGGYMNLFQQQASGEQYYSRDIARFTVFHKIWLYKTE